MCKWKSVLPLVKGLQPRLFDGHWLINCETPFYLVQILFFLSDSDNLTRPLSHPPHTMAEESLNLSLDDIIKRNADSSKRNRNDGGAARHGGRGGRGGRSGNRTSSFQPRIQTRVVKTIRGGGAGRPSSRGRNVRMTSRKGCLHTAKLVASSALTRTYLQIERSFLRDAPRDLDALEGPKAWGHNGFAEIQSTAPPRRAVQQRIGAADGSKL